MPLNIFGKATTRKEWKQIVEKGKITPVVIPPKTIGQNLLIGIKGLTLLTGLTSLGGGVGKGIAKEASTKIIPAVKTIVKSLTPLTPAGKVKGAIGLGVAGLVGVPALIQSKILRKKIVDIPKGLVGLGSDIGKTIEGEKPPIDLITENPLTTILLGAGLIFVGGKWVLPALSGIKTSQQLGDIEGAIKNLGQDGGLLGETGEVPLSSEGLGQTPTTSQVGEINPVEVVGTKPKYRYKYRKAKLQNISQRVNVIVTQRQQQNKKYLNIRHYGR